MDAFMHLLFKLIQVLFLVGAVGCLFVVPRTAVELFHTFFEPDTQEEIAGGPAVSQS